MTADDYQLLRREVQKLMEAEAAKQMGEREGSNEATIETEQHMASTPITPACSTKTAIMFNCLINNTDNNTEEDAGGNNTEKDLRDIANEELARFDKIQTLPLANRDGLYVKPLPWWRENSSWFSLLSQLAHVYLAIPATSAPLEQVLSRATRILTCLCARMKPEVTQGMMFLLKNLQVLHKHYHKAARKYCM